ncbi:hypothetical protein D9M68_877290 [compost metagenome]
MRVFSANCHVLVVKLVVVGKGHPVALVSDATTLLKAVEMQFIKNRKDLYKHHFPSIKTDTFHTLRERQCRCRVDENYLDIYCYSTNNFNLKGENNARE